MSWLSRLVGVDDVVRDLLRVAQAQTEVTAQMSHTMAQWMAMFETTGAPERRLGMSDEVEAALYEVFEAESAKHGPLES